MLWYQALILGIVQGLTEFLPISSSGHLVVLPIILGWGSHPLVFDLILHLGTATALIVYFRNDIKNILVILNKDLSKEKTNAKKFSYESKLGLFILIGCIPAGIFGILFEDSIEASFRGLISVSLLLLVGSLLMYLAEDVYKKHTENNSFTSLTGKSALLIGFFQAMAIFPGVSRSGATISGGMLLGLTREYAARFSFLLSIPIVVAASIFSLFKASNAELATVGLLAIFIGYLTSFVIGYLAIDFLLKLLKRSSLGIFIVYRLVLSFVLLLIYFNVLY